MSGWRRITYSQNTKIERRMYHEKIINLFKRIQKGMCIGAPVQDARGLL